MPPPPPPFVMHVQQHNKYDSYCNSLMLSLCRISDTKFNTSPELVLFFLLNAKRDGAVFACQLIEVGRALVASGQIALSF